MKIVIYQRRYKSINSKHSVEKYLIINFAFFSSLELG